MRGELLQRFGAYHPARADDDTVDFLRIVHKYLPMDGQVNLVEDVGCETDDKLMTLADSIDVRDVAGSPTLTHKAKKTSTIRAQQIGPRPCLSTH